MSWSKECIISEISIIPAICGNPNANPSVPVVAAIQSTSDDIRNINRLSVLSFKNSNNYPTRDSFNKYYMPLVKIKDINTSIDNKLFFDQPVKKKQEAYEKLIEMSRNYDYTTGNLLDFSYHQYCYNIIGIDLSRQTNTNIPQQINFTGKIEEDDGATAFFIAENQEKIILNYL